MVTANKEIKKPEDMKGMKLRVPPAPLFLMFTKSVGANATPIAFAEVYLALQQGTVDGQENPLPTIMAKKFYEVQSHIMLTGHITESLLMIVGSHVWAKLTRRREEDLQRGADRRRRPRRPTRSARPSRSWSTSSASSARPWSRSTARPSAPRPAAAQRRQWRLEQGGVRRAAGREVGCARRGSLLPIPGSRARQRAATAAPAMATHGEAMSASSAGQQPEQHLIVVEDEEVVIEHHPRGLAGLCAVLGAGLHRLPAVLHPLHPQRQPGLDRGDRPLRPDVRHLHRRRHGDAQEHAYRRRAAAEPAAAGPARAAAGAGRSHHARLPGAARLLLGADRGAHAVPAHDGRSTCP